MCLLITKPADAVLDSAVLARAFKQNSDGLGIAYHDGNARHVVKTLPQSPDDAVAFCAEYARPEYAAMVHFRFATHGAVNLDNQHPFSVPNTDLVLAHNGVLPHSLALDCGIGTDTYAFIRQYLVGIIQGRRALQRMRSSERALSELIGSGNKLAAMDARGHFAHVNKQCGISDDAGIWYSNDYALTSTLPARMLPKVSTLDTGGAYWTSDARQYEYEPTKAELWDYAQIALEEYADEVTFYDFERWLARFPNRASAESAIDGVGPLDLAADMLGVVFADSETQAEAWSE